MRRIYLPFLMIFFQLFFSCNDSKKPKTTNENKLYNFQQHDWRSNQIIQFINDINYSANEVPLQYYLLKNEGENFKKIDSIYQSHSRERIIEFEFQHIDQEDLLLDQFTNKTYDEAVKYLAFTITKDFKIVTSSNDTIQCSGVNFERNFKVAPFKRALLYFGNIDPNDQIKLIYNDELFNNGIIKFNFQETPIKL